MASTQFEALDARRAFPCVDEPAAKAVFGVTLTVPATHQCFSNMPETHSISLSRQLKQITFMDSPKMSTYLLAFCVGEFDFVQGQTQNGVLIKVYTPVGKSDSGAFALDCAIKCLDLYDDFFHVHYPLPKLDMVAIPEFAAGAMEYVFFCFLSFIHGGVFRNFCSCVGNPVFLMSCFPDILLLFVLFIFI